MGFVNLPPANILNVEGGGTGQSLLRSKFPSNVYVLGDPNALGAEMGTDTVVGSAATSNARVSYNRMVPTAPVDGILLQISTASNVVDSKVRTAIYEEDDTDGNPGVLIEDLGLLSLDSTGDKEWAFTVARATPFWVGMAWAANAGATTNAQYYALGGAGGSTGVMGYSAAAPFTAGAGHNGGLETIAVGGWDSAASSPAGTFVSVADEFPRWWLKTV